MIVLIIVLLMGCFIGFVLAAVLSANKYPSYTEDELVSELFSFKKYWLETLQDDHDQELAKDIIEDFHLGLLNEFRRD